MENDAPFPVWCPVPTTRRSATEFRRSRIGPGGRDARLVWPTHCRARLGPHDLGYPTDVRNDAPGRGVTHVPGCADLQIGGGTSSIDCAGGAGAFDGALEKVLESQPIRLAA